MFCIREATYLETKIGKFFGNGKEVWMERMLNTNHYMASFSRHFETRWHHSFQKGSVFCRSKTGNLKLAHLIFIEGWELLYWWTLFFSCSWQEFTSNENQTRLCKGKEGKKILFSCLTTGKTSFFFFEIALDKNWNLLQDC